MRREILSLGCTPLKFSGLERYKTHAQEPYEKLVTRFAFRADAGI
jgi:hypothetical protein